MSKIESSTLSETDDIKNVKMMILDLKSKLSSYNESDIDRLFLDIMNSIFEIPQIKSEFMKNNSDIISNIYQKYKTNNYRLPELLTKLLIILDTASEIKNKESLISDIDLEIKNSKLLIEQNNLIISDNKSKIENNKFNILNFESLIQRNKLKISDNLSVLRDLYLKNQNIDIVLNDNPKRISKLIDYFIPVNDLSNFDIKIMYLGIPNYKFDIDTPDTELSSEYSALIPTAVIKADLNILKKLVFVNEYSSNYRFSNLDIPNIEFQESEMKKSKIGIHIKNCSFNKLINGKKFNRSIVILSSIIYELLGKNNRVKSIIIDNSEIENHQLDFRKIKKIEITKSKFKLINYSKSIYQRQKFDYHDKEDVKYSIAGMHNVVYLKIGDLSLTDSKINVFDISSNSISNIDVENCEFDKFTIESDHVRELIRFNNTASKLIHLDGDYYGSIEISNSNIDKFHIEFSFLDSMEIRDSVFNQFVIEKLILNGKSNIRLINCKIQELLLLTTNGIKISITNCEISNIETKKK